MADEPQVVHIGKIERKRNPLGIVLCVAFVLVGLTFLVKRHDPFGIVFILIGASFLLVKETR